jgi:hypothetical protein
MIKMQVFTNWLLKQTLTEELIGSQKMTGVIKSNFSIFANSVNIFTTDHCFFFLQDTHPMSPSHNQIIRK